MIIPLFESDSQINYPITKRELKGRFYQFKADIDSIPKDSSRMIQGVFYRKDTSGAIFVEDGTRKISELEPLEDMDTKRFENEDRKNYRLNSVFNPINIDGRYILDGHHRVAKLEDEGIEDIGVFSIIPDLKEYFKMSHMGSLDLSKYTKHEWECTIREHELSPKKLYREFKSEGINTVIFSDIKYGL